MTFERKRVISECKAVWGHRDMVVKSSAQVTNTFAAEPAISKIKSTLNSIIKNDKLHRKTIAVQGVERQTS